MNLTGKHLSVRTLILSGLLLVLHIHCTRAEDQLEDATSANTRVLAAYAYKDGACGTTHQLTIPVLSDARREDIDLCIMQIINTDCATWGSENNLPIACLAISIRI